MWRPSLSLLLLAALAALAGCPHVTVWDEADGAVVLAKAPSPTLPETDHVPIRSATVVDRDGHTAHRLADVRAAVLWQSRADSGRIAVVSADGVLSVRERGAQRALLDGVVGAPVVVDEAHVVVARQTEPGETDLWLVPASGAPPAAVAPAPGADDTPLPVGDGRVAFVSGRSGVASLWLAAAGVPPIQLTNVGEVPGALTSSFVPVPEAGTAVSVVDGALSYVVDGRTVRVPLPPVTP